MTADGDRAGFSSSAPLWAIAALAGAAVVQVWPVRVWACLLVVATVLSLVGRAARPARVGVALVMLAAAASAGLRLQLAATGPVISLAEQGGTASLTLRTLGDARPSFGRWQAVARVESVDAVRSRERVLVTGFEPHGPDAGTVLQVDATARPLEAVGFDEVLARRHVVARVTLTGPFNVVGMPGPVWASTGHVRSRLRDVASSHLPVPPAGLGVGLVTGDTSLLPDDTADAMRDAGLTHLVAVSGSNVAVVTAGLLLLARLVGSSRRASRLLVAAGLAWFVVLTRAEPSVLRAVAMAAVIMAADIRGVASRPLHAVGVGVTALVLVDPLLATSLGLLLSVGATVGILTLSPEVVARLSFLPRPLAALIGVTIAAQVGVMPLLLLGVGEVPLASVPANVLAVPAAAVASVLLGLAAVLASVSTWLAAPLVVASRPFLEIVIWAASVGTGLPVLSPAAPLVLVSVVAGAVAVAAHGWIRQIGVAVALLAVLLGSGRLPGVGRHPPDHLVVTAIDVGQGDAILVEGPGVVLLVDGGSDPTDVWSWLRRRGVRRLDVVVQTHQDADHRVGLQAVLDHARVAALWHRPLPDEPTLDPAGALEVFPAAGQAISIGGLNIAVLWPPSGRPFEGQGRESNDHSIVLRIDDGVSSVLLVGDIEAPVQRRLLEDPAALRADVLVVPHHGAATSDLDFLTAVDPVLAVVSVGARNRFGHPRAEILERLVTDGAQIRRTDLDGDVRVDTYGLEHGRGRGASQAVGSAHAARPPPRRR